MMKRLHAIMFIFLLFWLPHFFSSHVDTLSAEPGTPPEVPMKGLVTMVDIGAKKCIPCKMMAPIMEELEKTVKIKPQSSLSMSGKKKIPTPENPLVSS